MDRVNRQVAISHQEEIILRKKREIEEKRKESFKTQFGAASTTTVKEEPNGNTTKGPLQSSSARSLAAMSRHRALLRSGMIGKTKSSISTPKINSSALKDCFDSSDAAVTGSSKLKKEQSIDSSEATSLSSSGTSNKSSVTPSDGIATAVGSQSSGEGGGEESAAWFQEALQRARLKAQQAGGLWQCWGPVPTKVKSAGGFSG